jgi:hypothetical protein
MAPAVSELCVLVLLIFTWRQKQIQFPKCCVLSRNIRRRTKSKNIIISRNQHVQHSSYLLGEYHINNTTAQTLLTSTLKTEDMLREQYSIYAIISSHRQYSIISLATQALFSTRNPLPSGNLLGFIFCAQHLIITFVRLKAAEIKKQSSHPNHWNWMSTPTEIHIRDPFCCKTCWEIITLFMKGSTKHDKVQLNFVHTFFVRKLHICDVYV